MTQYAREVDQPDYSSLCRKAPVSEPWIISVCSECQSNTTSRLCATTRSIAKEGSTHRVGPYQSHQSVQKSARPLATCIHRDCVLLLELLEDRSLKDCEGHLRSSHETLHVNMPQFSKELLSTLCTTMLADTMNKSDSLDPPLNPKSQEPLRGAKPINPRNYEP